MEKIQDYLQIKAAAEFVGVSPGTLRNWERMGKLTTHRHPINRYRLYKKEDLQILLIQVQNSKTHLSASDKEISP